MSPNSMNVFVLFWRVNIASSRIQIDRLPPSFSCDNAYDYDAYIMVAEAWKEATSVSQSLIPSSDRPIAAAKAGCKGDYTAACQAAAHRATGMLLQLLAMSPTILTSLKKSVTFCTASFTPKRGTKSEKQ